MLHARLQLARLEHGHGITLLTRDILNRRRNVQFYRSLTDAALPEAPLRQDSLNWPAFP